MRTVIVQLGGRRWSNVIEHDETTLARSFIAPMGDGSAKTGCSTCRHGLHAPAPNI
jgi:hypothetical protein